MEDSKGGTLPYSERTAVEADLARALLASLRPRVCKVFAAFQMLSTEEGGDVLHEALLSLAATPWEGTGLAGNARLRMLRYWRERQRRLLEVIDRTLLELLEMADSTPQTLRNVLGEATSRQRPRCRDLLRLRYGLGVETDLVGVKLGRRQAIPRKSTLSCLRVLAQEVLAWALDSGAQEGRAEI